jgi:hypothetical protein
MMREEFQFDPFATLCAIGLIALVIYAAKGVIFSVKYLFTPPLPPRRRSVEELDQEASELRANSRYLDALAENEIKAAHLAEQREFIRTQIGRR